VSDIHVASREFVGHCAAVSELCLADDDRKASADTTHCADAECAAAATDLLPVVKVRRSAPVCRSATSNFSRVEFRQVNLELRHFRPEHVSEA